MERLRLATVWLGGCSGCHMSFLDLDEWLIELAERADLVYSPLVDVKEYPESVDVVLVEGAVANEDNLEMIQRVRDAHEGAGLLRRLRRDGQRDGAAQPAGRRPWRSCGRSTCEHGDLNARIPDDRGVVPVLLDRVPPVHAVVPVDYYLPGCPPPADRIRGRAGGAARRARRRIWTGTSDSSSDNGEKRSCRSASSSTR